MKLHREDILLGCAIVMLSVFIYLLLVGCSPPDEVACRHIQAPGPAYCRDYMDRHWQLPGTTQDHG
jgi:hypothetical protein